MKFKSGRYTGVPRYLLNEHGYTMHSSELREALGLPARLPADFTATRLSRDGVVIEVRAKTKPGMEKRIFAKCPECPDVHWIEAGHLHQHVEAVHNH